MTAELFGLVAQEKPLLGKFCAVQALSSRRRWWTKIIDQSPCGKFIRLKMGGAQGRSRWIAAKDALAIREGRKGFDL